MARLVCVVDNEAARGGLATEHGLALWLEHGGRRILYDTGAGGALLPNLAELGLSPAALDAVVLSHGHYDHMGGLAGLLAARGAPLEVHAHPGVFGPHFKAFRGGKVDIGAPHGQAELEELGARFVWARGQARPWPGVLLLNEIPRVTEFEPDMPDLLADGPGPDPFPDDMALALEGRYGPAVLTGCAHAGAVNVLLAAEAALAEPPVWLIGGTHFGALPEARVRRAAHELVGRAQLKVAAGHCTGDAVHLLARLLGGRFTHLAAGVDLEL